MKYILSLLLLFPSFAHASYNCSDANNCTVTCDGANDHTDINSAIAAVNSGGTISIGAGTCDITATPSSITKAMTIQGAGSTSTHLVVNGQARALTVDIESNVAVIITGIHFDSSDYIFAASSTLVYVDSSVEATQIVIKGNKFEKGHDCIEISGWVTGVAYDNTFLNCERAVLIVGDISGSWARGITTVESGKKTFTAGTSDAFFIEDNDFTYNTDFPGTYVNPEQSVYHQDGGKTVTRYNDFDSTLLEVDVTFYDTHGNQGYYPTGSPSRAQPIVEVYSNTMAAYSSNRYVDFRGGSVLFYDNTLTTETGSGCTVIDATDEETWQTLMFDPLDLVWPVEDQFTNSFIWDNTCNTNPITDIVQRFASDEVVIQENRDYWMHEPAASGGYTYYDDRMGAAGNGADGTLSFSSSGANAYYPYTAYTYPHPLRGRGKSSFSGTFTIH